LYFAYPEKVISGETKKCRRKMNKSVLYNSTFEDLKSRLHLLADKPEETVESTLKALWLAAAEKNVSAETSLHIPLPDLTKSQIEKLHQLIELRLNNTPLAHLTQRQNFMGIELISDKRALIPRKETEILGKNALELSEKIALTKGSVKIIDVCCGSGNLGLAVAFKNPKCVVYSTDISQEAVDLTRENIELLKLNERVKVNQGDLLSVYETKEFLGSVDLIICNPPYILSSKVQKMDSEIASNEPVLAFDGGMLGIKIIQKLIAEAPKFLTNDGWLIFEVGAGQGDFIMQLCERSQLYREVDSISDEAGNKRVIVTHK
jgi:release factor glutamine methyltransferase